MKESTPRPIPRTPVVCLGCTLCCDDLELAVTEDRELDFSERFCVQGIAWFRRQAAAEQHTSANQLKVAGRAATRTELIQAAGRLLRAARSPLVCGLASVSMAEQQALVNLALQTGAAIDIDWQVPPLGNLAALQQTGRVTATLGQVAAQADLHLLIEAAPGRTHPRLGERLGWATQAGWRFRTSTLNLGTEPNAAARSLTELVCTDINELSDLVWWLRSLVRGIDQSVEACPAQWQEPLHQFLAAVRAAQGVTLIGGSALGKCPDLALQVHQLARELNELCKTWLLLASEDGNTAGAESVLSWSTGFPRCVDLRGGGASWQRGEFSAAELLERQESDLIICCVNEADQAAWAELPTNLREQLLRLPRIVFYSGPHPLISGADVAIPIAQVGWDASGEVVRLDELTLTAPRIVSSDRVSLEELLQELRKELA